MQSKVSTSTRRRFLKQAGLGGASLACVTGSTIGEQVDCATQKVGRRSRPSDLQITDLRVAEIEGAPMRVPIIRIDTNQGLSGYGEVRDGGSKRYALFLKSRLLGENPCNVESLFRKIKPFGNHGRAGGGVSGVEMALWDLAGRAYEVPVYQLLGGRYRDKIRLYTDTTASNDPDVYAQRMKERLDKGFTFLKMDFGIRMVQDIPGAITGAGLYDGDLRQWSHEARRLRHHPAPLHPGADHR